MNKYECVPLQSFQQSSIALSQTTNYQALIKKTTTKISPTKKGNHGNLGYHSYPYIKKRK